MIHCDVFDLDASVENRVLRWKVSSDLPGGTRIIVDISRRYHDTGGKEAIWGLWSDGILLTPTGPGDRNGASGTLDIDEGDAHGLSEFNELLGPYSPGIHEPVAPEVYIIVTVGARQPLRAFGKNNCNLLGGMVVKSGGINIVEKEVIVTVEMHQQFQPLEE